MIPRGRNPIALDEQRLPGRHTPARRELADRIRRQHEDGRSVPELATSESLCRSTVRLLLTEAGAPVTYLRATIAVPPPGSLDRADLADRLRDDYEHEGCSITDIATREGLTIYSTRTLLVEAGYRPRHTGQPPRNTGYRPRQVPRPGVRGR